MAGITGLGTTYNLPNFTGMLYGLTPTETPFFSAIGGLSGGGQSTTTRFQWSYFDLRDPSQKVALEGQDAPNPEERVRAFGYNTTQIHQEAVAVSYTKLAATGNLAGLNLANAQNNVGNELTWQVAQMLKQMVRDVEYSFLRGTFVDPADNTTARKTRGLLNAITTNTSSGGTPLIGGAPVTAASATDIFTATAHGLSNGAAVVLTVTAGTGGVTSGNTYYVRDVTANSFKISATKGGPAVDVTSDGTVTAIAAGGVTKAGVDELMQKVWENGGISDAGTATLITGSGLKPALSKAYITDAGFAESERTVGGVNLKTIMTDFGTLNIMLDRHMPKDTIAVVSLEECAPVYLEIPGKGHFFAEPLAKTGASEKVQLYGEVGLQYGNEVTHGKITGLAA
jgi:uncharacterized protein DUF5309